MDKNIYSLVTEFRKAVECAQNEGALKENQIISRFPKGCCGEISSLLAKYLFENGVDITGDQFKDNPLFLYFSEKVYVGPMNEFYELFEDIAEFPYEDFTEGTNKINIQRKKNYEIILGYIQN